MALDIARIKAAIVEVGTRATALEADGHAKQAQVAYETLFLVLHALCATGDDQTPGWARVVAPLTDLNRRLALDALAPPRLGQLRVRAAALLDLPDLTQVASPDDIQNTIVGAIGIGAPRYNNGDTLGCCTIYWATGQALLAAQASRGFVGYARALAPIRQVHEAEPPARTLDGAGIDDYAWTLRHAFDAALKVVG